MATFFQNGGVDTVAVVHEIGTGSNVGGKLYEACRLAATVLAYIQAWDVMRMLANKHTVSPPVTCLLVPTAAEGKGRVPTEIRQMPAACTE